MNNRTDSGATACFITSRIIPHTCCSSQSSAQFHTPCFTLFKPQSRFTRSLPAWLGSVPYIPVLFFLDKNPMNDPVCFQPTCLVSPLVNHLVFYPMLSLASPFLYFFLLDFLLSDLLFLQITKDWFT